MGSWVEHFLKENRTFLLFLFFMFVFRSAVADWNEVPTGSMKPTIVEGDRILVNKLAYDVRIPFTHVSLFRRADPESGDIVIFDSEAAGKRLVKRVIGVPGDLVSLRNNELHINGSAVAYTQMGVSENTVDLRETLASGQHVIRIQRSPSWMSSFADVIVPEDHYLVLGDNRDNSSDSRVIGMVPREEIVGRSRHVVLSLNYDRYYFPRRERWFRTL